MTILMTGATGNVGRQVVDRLVGAGLLAANALRWVSDHAADCRPEEA